MAQSSCAVRHGDSYEHGTTSPGEPCEKNRTASNYQRKLKTQPAIFIPISNSEEASFLQRPLAPDGRSRCWAVWENCWNNLIDPRLWQQFAPSAKSFSRKPPYAMKGILLRRTPPSPSIRWRWREENENLFPQEGLFRAFSPKNNEE